MNPKLNPSQYMDAAFEAGVKTPYLHTYVEILYRMQVHLRGIPGDEGGEQGACITAKSVCKKLKHDAKTHYRHLKWLEQRGYLVRRQAKAPYGAGFWSNWIVRTPLLLAIVEDAQVRTKSKFKTCEKSNGDWELPSGLSGEAIAGAESDLKWASVMGHYGLPLESSTDFVVEESTNAPTGAETHALQKLEQNYVLGVLKKQAKEAVRVVLEECASAGWASPKFNEERDVGAMTDLMSKARKHGFSVDGILSRLRHCVRDWNLSQARLVGKYADFPAHEHGPTFVALNGCFKQLFLASEQ